MLLYPAHRYDHRFRLKLSPLLWLVLVYGLRHVVLRVVDSLNGASLFIGDWASLQGSPVFWVSDVLVLAVLFLAGYRVPQAPPRIRRCWHQGRRLLFAAYALDTALLLVLRGSVLIAPHDEGFAWGLWALVTDLLCLAYLGRSRLVRDIFADFPELADHERERPALIVRSAQEADAQALLGMNITGSLSWTPAEAACRAVLQADRLRADAWHGLGIIAVQAEKLEVAMCLLREAVRLNAENALYRRNYGEVCRRLGRRAEAVFSGQEAVRLAPAEADAHYNLARALADSRRPMEAIAAYRQALALNPQHLAAWNNLGLLLRGQGRLVEAKEALSRAQACQALPESGTLRG